MSENMKKIYQAYADSIAPAPDMQERLKRQLHAQMQEKHPGKRRNGMMHFNRWLAATCVLFLVSGVCLIYAVMGTSRQTGRADGRWIIGADTGGTRLLGEKNVADTDIERYPEKEKPWILQEMLELDSVIVFCSTEDGSGAGKQMRMSEDELRSLCESLQSATICEDVTAGAIASESAVCYQVLIQYKPFISFTVYDDMYLQIGDETTIYKIKN